MAKFKRKSDFVLTLSLNPAKRFENVWGCLLLQGPIMIWFLWKSGLDDGLVGKERGGGGGWGEEGKWLLKLSDWPSVIVILLGSEGGSHVGSVKISKAKWHEDDAGGGAWIFKQGGRKLSMR